MKNYNKILEAVNRGIKLALDDFEDNELIGSTSQYNDVIYAEDVIKHKVDLMKEVVDLGLPSGTLWCKYNLETYPEEILDDPWACDFYGNYYSWGETKVKNDYSLKSLLISFCLSLQCIALLKDFDLICILVYYVI